MHAICRCVVLPLISLLTTGCVYRLQPKLAPSVYALKVASKRGGPITIQIGERDFAADANGAVGFEVPSGQGGCRVYLFDLIPINRASDASKERRILLLANGIELRRLSLREVLQLPTDLAGTRVLKLN